MRTKDEAKAATLESYMTSLSKKIDEAISNGNYSITIPLPSPQDDASKVISSLTGAGYSVKQNLISRGVYINSVLISWV